MRISHVPGKPGHYQDEHGEAVPYTTVFPFAHNVDLADANQIIVLRDMPSPHNLTVHVTNEHKIDPDPAAKDLHRLAWLHMDAHVHGKFRDGAEHFHTDNFA